MARKIHSNVHHLAATSRGGTNHPDNKKRMEVKDHNALHRIFGNQLPHEQILSILQFNKGIFREDFLRCIASHILSHRHEEMYQPQAIAKDRLESMTTVISDDLLKLVQNGENPHPEK